MERNECNNSSEDSSSTSKDKDESQVSSSKPLIATVKTEPYDPLSIVPENNVPLVKCKGEPNHCEDVTDQINIDQNPLKEKPKEPIIKGESEGSSVDIKQEQDSGFDSSVWLNENSQNKEVSPEKRDADPDSANNSARVTLKRKSHSLAIISSYDVSSDSDDGFKNSAFKEPQKAIVISDSSSESDSESGSVFNLDSDDASNESSQSSSEDNNQEGRKAKKENLEKGVKPKTAYNILDVGELPPIKDLQISVKEDECLPFGKVHSIVDTLVVIESLPDVPALNLDSVLFTKSGEPLGEVFDVFGPVKRPYYTIRFKKAKDIVQKSLTVGTTVYCAPKTKYTQYVFVHQLARVKGSDASWKNDMEPPPEYLDYSDDEEEKLAKKLLRQSREAARAQKVIDVDAPPVKKKNSFEEKMNQRNTLRNQMFIRNSPPERRRPDWYRAPAGPSNENSRSSGHGLVRPPQFTPIQFQQPNSPRSFFPPNLGGGNMPIISCNPPRPVFNNSFRIRTPGNQTSPNQNSNVYSPVRPPTIFLPQNNQSFPGNNQCFQGNNQTFQGNSQGFQGNSQAFQGNSQGFQGNSQGFQGNSQGFQGNNNPHFPCTNPPFNQGNGFQQQTSQPYTFSGNSPIFHSPNPQYQRQSPGPMIGTVSSPNRFQGFVAPPFDTHLRPYQPYCFPSYPGGGCPFPTHSLHPQGSSPFGANIGRPVTPTSPPALFSFSQVVPTQRNPYPSSPSFPNSSHMPAFRHSKPK